MIELVIFDWDGTLVDSGRRIVFAMRAAFGQNGLPAPAEQTVREIIGLELAGAIRRLDATLDEATVTAIGHCYKEQYAVATEIATPLFRGAAETLAALSDSGIALAIATSKSRPGLDAALANTSAISPLFAASRTADDCPGKPHPAMVNEILRELGASPDAAVVVGDTEFDMKMAHNAGVAAVAAVYGNHASERLIASRPLATIGSLHDLPLVLASARSLRRPRAGRDDARETRRNGFP